jgi:SAM-dependent methyltransferase
MDLQLCVEYPLENQRFSGDIYLAGWVISKEGSASISIEINDKKTSTLIARMERLDVFTSYPEYKSMNPMPGFTAVIRGTQISSGVNILKVIAKENDNHISKSIKIRLENRKLEPKIINYFKFRNIVKIFSTGKTSRNRLIESKDDNNIGIDRKQMILSKIKSGVQEGLEIGPLCTPIVTKSESNGHVWYVDRASTEELKEIYRDVPYVVPENIVNVDFIWGTHSFSELVKGNIFDYAIASHVIEHVPDMLGWIKEIGEVLKDNGILSLVIPDKRYTFDYLRELSTPGMLVEAYLHHQRRPGPREIFDYLASAREIDVVSAWNGTIDKSSLLPLHDPQFAFDIAKESINSDNYHDAHVNTFTPESFLNLLETFAKVNLFDFKVVDFYDTLPNTLEFFISLERMPRNSNRKEYMFKQLESLSKARKQIL